MGSLGTSPNQGGDCFQHPTLKNGLGYSLSPICSVPRNLWGQEMNVIIKYLTAHGSLNYQTMEEALAYAVTKLSYESLRWSRRKLLKPLSRVTMHLCHFQPVLGSLCASPCSYKCSTT